MDPFYNNGGIHNQFEEIKSFILNQSKEKKIYRARNTTDFGVPLN